MSDDCCAVSNDGCHDVVAGPLGSASARRLRLDGFVALWQGERPAITELTDDEAMVRAMVSAGRLEVDGHGVLVGVHGLAARVTEHRIEHADGVVHTWCALDAIGVPAALAIDAAAVTTCPACGAELRVRLQRGAPVDGGERRLWLPGGRHAHLVDDFCHHANLYCCAGHLTSTVEPGTVGRAVTVTAAAAIGRDTWRDVSTVLRDPEGESHDERPHDGRRDT